MTKEITKAKILQEIQDKFEMRDFLPEKFLFSEIVLPTYDIGPHVKDWTVEKKRIQITANGALNFYSCPSTERWSIRKLDIYSETGGNYDIDRVLLRDSDSLKFLYVFFSTAAPLANGTVTQFNFVQDLFMKRSEMMHIVLNISNFVAGGWVTCEILKEVEVVR